MDGVVMVSAFMAITLLHRKSSWVLLMIHRQAMPHLKPRLTCPDGLPRPDDGGQQHVDTGASRLA